MSGSFRARDSLQGHKGNGHREKKEKTTLIGCLHKAAALLNDSADNIFYTSCICQKIYDICWQIENAYRGKAVPVLVINGQSPEEIIEAVKNRIASDGTISGGARETIIKELKAARAMING